MNGRLDLAQVEGLGDLLAAETAAQQRQALALMGGALSRLAADWGAALVRALAFVEATIDFADEELPADLLDGGARRTWARSLRRCGASSRGSRMAERVRDGFEVALVGRPNVGKSTLLNALAGREAALTSEVAGTTRDVIEVRMDLDGLALTLLDMAGLRDGGGRVEGLGVARARERAARADLRVFLVDEPAEAGMLGVARRAGRLTVLAKADLRAGIGGAGGVGDDRARDRRAAGGGSARRCASGPRGAGTRVAAAAARGDRAGAGGGGGGAAASSGAARRALELAAEELRAALRALDFLVGKVDVEAVLDVIFQSFCLGK